MSEQAPEQTTQPDPSTAAPTGYTPPATDPTAVDQGVPQDPAQASTPSAAPEPAAAPAEPEPAPEPSSSLKVGGLVTWEESPDGSDVVGTRYGLLVDDDVALSDEETAVRVVVLHDLRVLDPEQLTAL